MESTPSPVDRPITPEEVAANMGVEGFKVSPVITGEAEPTTKAERSIGMSCHRTGFGRKTRSTPSKQSRAIYLEFMSAQYEVEQIAAKWGIEPAAVKRHVSYVHEWTLRNWQSEMGPLRSDHDLRLREIESLALEAFRKSKQPKRSRKRIRGTGGDGEGGTGEYTRNEVSVEETVGDPRFLNVALGSLKQRSELWGMDAPKKTALTNASGDGPMQVEVTMKKLEQMDDETLRKLRIANRVLQNIELKQDAIDAEFTAKGLPDADQAATAGASDEPVRAGTGTGSDGHGCPVDESPVAAAAHQSGG